jgi:uncharacterized protein (TIGR02284 family)
MKPNEKDIEVLNDLVQINNDRITGYEKAADESRDIDVDLRSIFARMAEESRQYKSELISLVTKLGGEPATGTTASGKIYRAWMDVKATFTGKDRHAILASCEYGEDAAQKAYKDALGEDGVSVEVREVITKQKASLRTSHDLIKQYRDMHEHA